MEGPEGGVLLLVGQDRDSVRGYREEANCPAPAGVTTYLSLYDLLNPDASYGGLGLDGAGHPTASEVDWGGGPLHLWRTAQDPRPGVLAVGLDFSERSPSQSLTAILRGDFDTQISHLGRSVGRLNRPILLRVGYEFDGAWNAGYAKRSAYILVFRRIVRAVRAKARNVAFVWQASASLVDDVIDGAHEDLSEWYPGDAYVDWVGMSWFLAPARSASVGPRLKSQGELYAEVLRFARARDKPVFIAEAAPQGYHLSGRFRANVSPLLDGAAGEQRRPVGAEEVWRSWYLPLFEFIEQHRDQVRALAYINADWDAQDLWDAPYENGFWGDSRVQADPGVLHRWRDRLSRVGWIHGSPDLYRSLGFEGASWSFPRRQRRVLRTSSAKSSGRE